MSKIKYVGGRGDSRVGGKVKVLALRKSNNCDGRVLNRLSIYT